MEKKGSLTKTLAVVGTVLVWIPVLAPILFAAASLIQAGMFRFDYLMPAELFPVALVGGGLLLWAALRARARRGLIGGSLAGAVILPVAGQALAVSHRPGLGPDRAGRLAVGARPCVAGALCAGAGDPGRRRRVAGARSVQGSIGQVGNLSYAPLRRTSHPQDSRRTATSTAACSARLPPSSMICTLPRSNALPTLFPSPRLR